MLLSVVVAALVSQQPNVEATAPAAAPAPTSEAAALERLGVAAERLAAAAERLSPPPAPAVKEPPKEDLWSGSVGAGLTWVTGNVSSISFVASGQATRKGEHTIFVAKAFGGYGEKINAVLPNEVLLYNFGASAQLDYRFTKHISAFLGAGIDTDHVKGVEVRGYGDLGVGVLWLDVKEGEPGSDFQKLYLKTDLNLRVQPERRMQYYPTLLDIPDAMLIGPRLALSFRYALSKGTSLQEEAELLPNVVGASRVMINSATKLAVSIAGSFALTVGFTVKYDSAPAVGFLSTDTILGVGLEATF